MADKPLQTMTDFERAMYWRMRALKAEDRLEVGAGFMFRLVRHDLAADKREDLPHCLELEEALAFLQSIDKGGDL